MVGKKEKVRKRILQKSKTRPKLNSTRANKQRKSDVHILERKKTAALLHSFKEEAVVLREQRKKLHALSKVIEVHIGELEQNINTLSSVLKTKSRSRNTLTGVKSSVKKLQSELEAIERTRKNLVDEERRVLVHLHNVTNKKDIKKAQNKHFSAKLKEIEITLQYLLDEADYLLRQGQEINSSHFQIMQEIATKEKGAISQLTKRLLELKKEREDVLNKKELVEDGDKQLEKNIKSLKNRQIKFKKNE